MIEWIFYLVLLCFGIPTGLLLAKLCSDEIYKWKSRFKLMIIISIILSLILSLTDFIYKLPIIISLLFIIVVNLTIIKKIK